MCPRLISDTPVRTLQPSSQHSQRSLPPAKALPKPAQRSEGVHCQMPNCAGDHWSTLKTDEQSSSTWECLPAVLNLLEQMYPNSIRSKYPKLVCPFSYQTSATTCAVIRELLPDPCPSVQGVSCFPTLRPDSLGGMKSLRTSGSPVG